MPKIEIYELSCEGPDFHTAVMADIQRDIEMIRKHGYGKVIIKIHDHEITDVLPTPHKRYRNPLAQ